MTAELRLVAACSWAPPEPYLGEQGRRIGELCREGVAWERVLALAVRHQTVALACAALERWGREAVPAGVMEELGKLAGGARRRALLAAAESARIARGLGGGGFGVLPLKGAALSEELYGDPAARQAADVDLLVRKSEVERAEEVLAGLGYEAEFPAGRMTPRMRELVRRCASAVGYRHGTLPVAVDLHWDQELWTGEQLELLWRRSEAGECLGVPMRRLDGDALLVYLCDHGTKHNWSRVKWLSDVAMLLARGRERPWAELFALAGEMGAGVALAGAALLAEQVYGLALGVELGAFARGCEGGGAVAGEGMAAMCLTEAELRAVERGQWLPRKLRQQMRRRPGVPLVDHLRARLLHAEDLARFALPDSLLWLHYPLRPVFWLWRRWGHGPLC